MYRLIGEYTRAVDELLTAVDKSGEEGGGGGGEEREERGESGSVSIAARRQLVLTYNDFAILCYK